MKRALQHDHPPQTPTSPGFRFDAGRHRTWAMILAIVFMLGFVLLFGGGAVARIAREFMTGTKSLFH